MNKKGKPRTRANGEGTCYKRKNGTYTAQITSPDGKRRAKSFKFQREAREWLTQQRREMDTGDYIISSVIPLGIWLDKWVEVFKSHNVSQATLNSYRYSRDRLPQSLLDMPISQITPADIQKALNAITGERRTVEITRTFLLMAFDQAVTDMMIRNNPVKSTNLPPKKTERKAKALTREEEEELTKILSAPVKMTSQGKPDKSDLASQTIRHALLFALRTGASRGEVVSIRWDDIGPDQIHIPGTKNEHRNRFIPYPDEEIRAMLEYRKAMANSEYVFATRNGQKLDGTNLLRWMEANTEFTVHDLRHTYCTRGAQAGVNPKTLQKLTGHSRIETLLDIYTHVSDQDKADAAAKISNYCNTTATNP